jgi:hypothetical protein
MAEYALAQQLADQKQRNKDLERRIRKELEPLVDRLYVENARLTEALRQIDSCRYECYGAEQVADIAAAALKEQP